MRLLGREARVGEQLVDQLRALLRIAVREEALRLVVCRNVADQVEIDAAQERGVIRLAGRRDVVFLPGGANLGVDGLAQRLIAGEQAGGCSEQGQTGGEQRQAGHERLQGRQAGSGRAGVGQRL